MSNHTAFDSAPQGEPQTNLTPDEIDALIETITQAVIGDADELTYAQAQHITWLVAQALAAQQQKGGA